MSREPELLLLAVVAPLAGPCLPGGHPLQPPPFGRETGSEGSGVTTRGTRATVPHD